MLGSNLVASRTHLDNLLLRANSIAYDLQQGKGTAGRLLTDPSAADALATLLTNANSSIDDLKGTLAYLEAASGNIWLASTNLPAISETLHAEIHDLPGLVHQTQISMRELERLITAMQRHWLWRKYLDQASAPAVPANLPNVGPILRSPAGARR